MTWTPKLKAEVVKHWNDGKSATDIRRWLMKHRGVECSRNAVIGVVFRSGQSNRPKAEPAPKVRRVPPSKPALKIVKDEPRVSQPAAPKPAPAKAPKPRFPERKIPPRPVSSEPIFPAIFALPDPTCRWIIGDALEGRTCEAERRPGSPYCPRHHAKAYVPLTPEQKAGKLVRVRW